MRGAVLVPGQRAEAPACGEAGQDRQKPVGIAVPAVGKLRLGPLQGPGQQQPPAETEIAADRRGDAPEGGDLPMPERGRTRTQGPRKIE